MSRRLESIADIKSKIIAGPREGKLCVENHHYTLSSTNRLRTWTPPGRMLDTDTGSASAIMVSINNPQHFYRYIGTKCSQEPQFYQRMLSEANNSCRTIARIVII